MKYEVRRYMCVDFYDLANNMITAGQWVIDPLGNIPDFCPSENMAERLQSLLEATHAAARHKYSGNSFVCFVGFDVFTNENVFVFKYNGEGENGATIVVGCNKHDGDSEDFEI